MPKITEINQICQEIGRDKVYYEPEIQTDIMPDGKKVAKVVVRVYADRNVKEESGIIPWEVFTNKIYFDIKDLYENAEETGFKEIAEVENDGETFGWALADSWHHLGNVFYFLLSVYNLLETTKDDSPIIDTKGIIQGKLTYSITLELLDVDRTTKLNPLEYENLNELIGKNLKIKIELKKASELPDKYIFKTMCRYSWNDNSFETNTVERKKDPVFDYCSDHLTAITEDMVSYLMYNTLTVGVFGMIESKRKARAIAQKEIEDDQNYIEALKK